MTSCHLGIRGNVSATQIHAVSHAKCLWHIACEKWSKALLFKKKKRKKNKTKRKNINKIEVNGTAETPKKQTGFIKNEQVKYISMKFRRNWMEESHNIYLHFCAVYGYNEKRKPIPLNISAIHRVYAALFFTVPGEKGWLWL